MQKKHNIFSIIGQRYTNHRKGGFFIHKMAIIKLELSSSDKDKLMTLCEKDVLFTAAKTLTQTAQKAQKQIQQHLHSTFVLRKPNFEKSIKVRSATKQTLQASVYTMVGFATLQQTGGRRVAKTGQLAIPQYDDLRDIKAVRKTNQPDSFLMKLKSGGMVIARRVNKNIEILYHIKNVAFVPKRLEMIEIGEDVAKTEFPRLFSQNLQGL